MRAEKLHTGAKNMTTITDQLLTRKQVAEIFQISPMTVIRLEKDGKLRPVRLGAGSIRHRKSDVEAYVSWCLSK